MSEKKLKSVGRPQKYELDLEMVEEMASYGSTIREISAVLKVPEHVLRRRGKDAMKIGGMRLNQRLRKAQIKHALNGSVPLLIWLGKQRLNQTDNGTFEEDELLDDVEFDLDE